jgi:hypothetical protein
MKMRETRMRMDVSLAVDSIVNNRQVCSNDRMPK